LRPIETVQQTIEEGGIDFVIRSVSSLARKALDHPRGAGDAAPAADPFLPFDPNLFVADISPTHVGPMAALRAVSGGVV
jgi:ATP adenylyltransferase